ncbi:N-terminal acetyltransferase A, auxiliary subunit [Dentipellis sp. KUC8613]|nr:N-terminal acetyltransferase A, auxiliary subunit [Dentipellis sp. KUC8613]
MPPALAAPSKRALPSKEAGLFREVLTLYEARQLKKGLKAADTILKKFPEHGETLCMRGLILTHMGRREEGLEHVKKGVRFDLTSHIVWHVFGLIQKGQKNYEEALKSYTQALRFDKDNINILRDAAHLQTQLRQYEHLVETRHTLLQLRPSLRQNWMALAVAYHLNGNLPEAKKVLEQYERTLKNVPDYDFEQSETLLYHVRLLEELGETSEALALLDVNAKSRVIVDRVSIMEIRARLISKLGMADEAEQAWRTLIQHNPDGLDYYRGLLRCKGIDLEALTDSTRVEARHILRELSEQFPRADKPTRLSLTVTEGDEFTELARAYLLRGLTKGIPSLFADVKSLYASPAKQSTIESIVDGFRTTLADGGSLSADAASGSAAAREAPTTYLWTLYFLAQHHSARGAHAQALELLDVALTHTPTLPELRTFRGRVLKRAGDPYGAARALDAARLLDGQDRFLNTKSAKYRLRAGEIEEAQEVFGMFTKKDAPSPGADLEDMQSLLYLTEEGDAHRRNGKLNLALKKYHAVQKVFAEIEDDQFDFHGYSIRKFIVNSYIDMVQWEDHLRSHPSYVSTALSASRIYVRVHDDPSIGTACTSSGTLTESEKKAKKKASKKAAQKLADDVKKAAASAGNEDKGLDVPTPKDDDPDGTKLLTGPEPLERAWKFLLPLTTLAKDNIDVWIAVYDVAVRRGKYLQAARALKHAKKLDEQHPDLHVRLLHFRKTHAALSSPLPEPVGPVVSAALAELLPNELSSEAANAQYLQQHPSSATAILAAARGLHILGRPCGEVDATVFGVLNPGFELTVPYALEVLAFLKDIGSPRADEFRAACDASFHLATVFKTPEEIAALKKAAAQGVQDTEKEVVE